MKEKDDEKQKNLVSNIVLVLMLILVISVIPLLFPLIFEEDSEKCSRANTFTNYSVDHTYILGKCLYEEPSYYLTNEVCKGGFLGIGMSCYESSKEHSKFYSTTRCFELKTGEKC